MSDNGRRERQQQCSAFRGSGIYCERRISGRARSSPDSRLVFPSGVLARPQHDRSGAVAVTNEIHSLPDYSAILTGLNYTGQWLLEMGWCWIADWGCQDCAGS